MTAANDTTSYTKEARYIGPRDWAAVVNGAEIGYAASRLAAQRIADDFVAGQIAHEAQCQAAEALAATVEPVAAPVAPAVVVVTGAALAEVIEDTTASAPSNPRWAAALRKAAERLTRVRWSWDATSGRLLIASATSGGQRYLVEPGRCSCPAGARSAPCWHRAGRQLIIRAAARSAQFAA